MTSILDQHDSQTRRTGCPNCGGTVLTGCLGSEQEHDYCDSCDWSRDRSEVDTWYTWRTDAAHAGLWAADATDALATLIARGEWAEIDSERERADIADGAWLTIRDASTYTTVVSRGQTP